MTPYWQSSCGRYTLYHGDCLEVLPTLEAGSVDAVVTDPPYGTTNIEWDHAFPLDSLWPMLWRVAADDETPVVMTARQPFTTRLISSQLAHYRHGWIWDKKFAGAFVLCNHQPMQVHEDVCVFGCHGVRYRPQMIERDTPIKLGGKRPGPGSPINSPLPDSKTYTTKYPTSIINISNRSEQRGLHPTQKPVSLVGYLVRTYTDADHVILDPFLGSGTTGVACVKTNRRFIGVEIDERYCEIAAKRIEREAAHLFAEVG